MMVFEKTVYFITKTVSEIPRYFLDVDKITNATIWTTSLRSAMCFRTRSGAEHFRFSLLKNRKDIDIIEVDGTGLV